MYVRCLFSMIQRKGFGRMFCRGFIFDRIRVMSTLHVENMKKSR